MKFSKLLYPVLLLLICIISGCEKDNPVVKNPGFQLDTAKFRWEATPIPFDDFYGQGLWAVDTNEVFVNNFFYKALLHIRGIQVDIMYYPDSTNYHYIDGLNPSEGYMVCSRYKDDRWQPVIKRWNGTSFTDIPIAYNFKKPFDPSCFYLKSPSEMWIGDQGFLHKFDGVNLTQQYLQDTEIVPIKIFLDPDNHLKFLGRKYLDSITHEYVFEQNGNNWVKIFEDTHLVWDKYYEVMSNFVYVYQYRNIYKLDGSVLTLALKLPPEVSLRLPFAGSSFNDFMAGGYVKGGTPPGTVLYWDGTNWSSERADGYYVSYSDNTYIQRINNNFYCGIVQNVPVPFLIRGFRKTKM
ncbi:MAG: hypothetical protein PHN88_15175 [Ignavibacteria bacterium]|nr:hypothetical protein [Ignavibacteria bacterium]